MYKNSLATTYFPTPSQVQYRQRYDVSLPCSGWIRVVPTCSNHQGAMKYATSGFAPPRCSGVAAMLVAGAGFEPATFGL